MDIQIHTTSFSAEAERDTTNMTLRGVDLSQLIGQINATDVLEALKANDQYDEIVKFVEDDKSEGEYELPGFSDVMGSMSDLNKIYKR